MKAGLLTERPANANAPAWRETKNGPGITLVITEAGLQAIDNKVATKRPTNKARKTTASSQTKKTQERSKRGRPRIGEKTEPRPGTKLAVLVDLLNRKQGATIAEIVAATEWQAHSVRGAISGSVKKKFGLAVTSEKDEKRGRVYRIAGKA